MGVQEEKCSGAGRNCLTERLETERKKSLFLSWIHFTVQGYVMLAFVTTVVLLCIWKQLK